MTHSASACTIQYVHSTQFLNQSKSPNRSKVLALFHVSDHQIVQRQHVGMAETDLTVGLPRTGASSSVVRA